jgi:GAF domain-containing protein
MHPSSTRTEYEKRQLAFYRHIQGLQKQDAIEGMGKLLFDFLKEWFQFELIWIAQYDAQSHLLSGIQGVLPKTTERDTNFLRRKQPILPGDLFDQVLLTGTLQEIPSLKQEQRVGDWQAVAQSQNIQGSMILPIRYRQQSFGAILVGTTLWGGHPRPEEMTELKMLAATLGTELHRLQSQSASLPVHQSPQLSIDSIGRILAAETFEERLPLVLEQLHQAIRPARTCVYWFDTENQSCRLYDIYTGPSPRRSSTSKVIPRIDLSLQSIASFYQSSLQNQTVAIADMQGLITSNQAPTRLMTMTRSRAWLSAPIFDRGRLIAVLATEDSDPHLWSDTDRQSIQLLAKLLGQGSQENVWDSTLTKGERFGLHGLLSVLKDAYNDTEQWDPLLLQCLEQITVQFSVRWTAIVTHDAERQDFKCHPQFYSKKKQQPLADRLPELSAVDAKMLARMSSPIAVQSLAEDLRLLAWRQPLSDRGVKSLLCLKLDRTLKHSKLGSFLLLATDLPRTWMPEEIEAAVDVVEPLGQALSQREQWQYDEFRVQFMTALNHGLQSIQLTPPGDALFATTAQALHALLDVECLMVLRWSPDRPEATIAALINQSKFHVNEQIPISWKTDSFLQRVLSRTANTPTSLPELFVEAGEFEEIAAANSGWLGGMGRVDLLAVPLRVYPEDPCLGVVLILDSRSQYWTDLAREGIQLLTRELTLNYRSHYLLERLKQKQDSLECLGWYKQRHLEHISQLWTAQMSQIPTIPPAPGAVAAGQVGLGQAGSRLRSDRSSTDLYSAFSGLETILKNEVWDLQLAAEQVQVATLLRRSLERIEELARTRQLWTQVHNLTPSVSLHASAQKLELMLVELLRAACYRSKSGDRIDIWCRALPEQWVEISITDNGRLNPRMIQAIQHPSLQVSLSASILEAPPGLHYKVCQSLVERMGGQLEMAQLEDGRAMSRLILPIASAAVS